MQRTERTTERSMPATLTTPSSKRSPIKNQTRSARMNETIEAKAELVTAAPITPMMLLQQAVTNGADLAVLEKFMDLQERWERNQARKAYEAAIALAKAELPVIPKTKHVRFQGKTGGVVDYKHEELSKIAELIDPVLGRHGLSYRFRTTSVVNEPVRVTCVVAHRDGYFEENTLEAGRDTSGSKNDIQAVGSTVTYLQRYTLKAALGLSAADDD